MSMSAGFNEVKVHWDGVDYIVPEHKVMGLINMVEENHVTLMELSEWVTDRRKMKSSKLADAWASVITYAGRPTTQQEVYLNMFKKFQGIDGVLVGLQMLLLMMVPKDVSGVSGEVMPDAPKTMPKKSPVKSNSSGKRSRRRSVSGG